VKELAQETAVRARMETIQPATELEQDQGPAERGIALVLGRDLLTAERRDEIHVRGGPAELPTIHRTLDQLRRRRLAPAGPGTGGGARDRRGDRRKSEHGQDAGDQGASWGDHNFQGIAARPQRR
jgi:hypothetical protein